MSTPLQLTLQAYIGERWYDAMTLAFVHPEQGRFSPCAFRYTDDYVADFHHEQGSLFAPAISVRHRLDWECHYSAGFPAFLYDIVPSGAARQTLARCGAGQTPAVARELSWLKYCTPAPIGHLRVKESAERVATASAKPLRRDEVIQHTLGLFEPCNEYGLATAGALGAGGEAPKLLLAESHDGELQADAALPDPLVTRHWLVKFPRRATALDRDILHSEYLYYRAVGALGLESIALNGLAFEEAGIPSLWMPRFDRAVIEGRVQRIPVESIYSLSGNVQPGSSLCHERVVARLVALWRDAGQSHQVEDLVFEYLQRDLLNRILGNTDNHGRNIAILRGDRLTLAPIYDLAPMVLDPEGISRSTKWAAERSARQVWWAACQALVEFAEPGALFERLRDAAQRFRALPDLLSNLPTAVRRAPVIPLNNLDARLREWGLC